MLNFIKHHLSKCSADIKATAYLLMVNQHQHACRLYANDCILYRQIEREADVRILQNDLKILEEWERTWKMKLNIDKCIVLSVTLKSNPTKTRYTLHNQQLLSVHSAKYLGVTIDSKLSFNEHVDSTCKKATQHWHSSIGTSDHVRGKSKLIYI